MSSRIDAAAHVISGFKLEEAPHLEFYFAPQEDGARVGAIKYTVEEFADFLDSNTKGMPAGLDWQNGNYDAVAGLSAKGIGELVSAAFPHA